MQRIAILFAILQLIVAGALAEVRASAQEVSASQYGSMRSVTRESWVEEWDAASGRWVRVSDVAASEHTEPMPTVTTTFVNGQFVGHTREAQRYAAPYRSRGAERVLGHYGPFVVTSDTKAKMVGATNASTPRHFDAMLRDFPQLAVLEMVEAPGTTNDIANLAVGRRIRSAGLATRVPRGGSVRSGAVELFLAGVSRQIDDGAQFAVHSWLDNHGREADDFAPEDPAHRLYLDYYVEMGMSEERAREFYTMTNSVPHAAALWLKADDMRFWLRPEQGRTRLTLEQPPVETLGARLPVLEFSKLPVARVKVPAIAYVDLSTVGLAQLEL